VKISAKDNYEIQVKQNEEWYDEKYSKLLYIRKETKLKWLQIPCQTNGDNPNNIRGDSSRAFQKQKEGICEVRN
jgi:hypothetical protein